MQLIRHVRYVERKRELKKRRSQKRLRKYRKLRTELTRKGILVSAPEQLFLHGEGPHDALIGFIGRMRAAISSGRSPVTLDFSATVSLMPGGALLFYAELDRVLSIYPSTSLRFLRSRNDTVNQVLEHLGVYMRGGYSSGATPSREDVISWRVVASASSDGEVAGPLIETYESLNAEDSKRLFRGVSEAIPNAVEHAYIDERGDGIPPPPENRWWMFCRESDNRFYVGVCDLGIGIPRSLPKTFSELFYSIFPAAVSPVVAKDDAAMIRAAMEISRTRTKLHERGKGLGDIRSVVDEIEGSELYVFSNSGLVTYISGSYRLTRFNQSILGTLIVWIIPLKGSGHELKNGH
ncbi:MAG: hypothetical protein ABIJ73_01645 [Pseudomonadota bacterium]